MSERMLFDLPVPCVQREEAEFRERLPIWTGCKAKLIERYLFYFVQITYHGTYIDGFAGPQRETKQDMWAAKLVIESQPRWLRNFFLFELDRKKVKMLQRLRKTQPPPDKKKKEAKRRVRANAWPRVSCVVAECKTFVLDTQSATFYPRG